VKDKANIDLIESLSNQLTPVKVLWSAEKRFGLWLLAHTLWIFVLMVGIQPFRSTFMQDFSHPQFVLEMIMLLVAVFVAGYFSFLSVVPGAVKPERLKLSVAPFLVLILLLLYGIWSPFKVHTSLGMRSYCDIEILVYSLIPLLHVFFLAKKGFFMDRKWTLACATLASALIPALLMHLACMYEPTHILIYHLGPVLLVALLGTGLLFKYSRD